MINKIKEELELLGNMLTSNDTSDFVTAVAIATAVFVVANIVAIIVSFAYLFMVCTIMEHAFPTILYLIVLPGVVGYLYRKKHENQIH